MALPSTLYHLQIALSDVDRGAYESLDLRVARHPSESMRHMLARTLGYCLLYEEGIAFGKGLADADEPAVSVRSMTGELRVWVDVGSPSPERLHRASKAAGRVVVFTQHDPELIRRQARGKVIHRRGEVEIYALAPAFLDALEAVTDRNARWELVRNDGRLYVTAQGKVIEGSIERSSLDEEG